MCLSKISLIIDRTKIATPMNTATMFKITYTRFNISNLGYFTKVTLIMFDFILK